MNSALFSVTLAPPDFSTLIIHAVRPQMAEKPSWHKCLLVERLPDSSICRCNTVTFPGDQPDGVSKTLDPCEQPVTEPYAWSGQSSTGGLQVPSHLLLRAPSPH